MGTDSDQAKLLITKLNGSNYHIWKLKMKVLLMRDGLWDVVNDIKPEPTPHGWHQRESKAIAAICLTVEDDQLLHLTQLETAREMWQALQRLHERSSIGNRLYLKRKLYSMRFTHGTMQSHLNAMLEIVAQLRGMGKNIEDDDLVAVMLCSLPDSYSALITALEGRNEADLTVEYVTGKLLDEYQRRIEDSRNQNSSETALKSIARYEHRQAKPKKTAWTRPTRSEDRECYFCRKKGHIKANCRKYKRQFEKEEKAKHIARDEKRHNEARDVNVVADAVRHLSFAAHDRTCKACRGQWYVDSGATSHMTNDKDFFTSLRPTKATVYLADSNPAQSEGIGEGWLFCITPTGTIERIHLKEVLYVPSLEGGLLSVQRLTCGGCTVTFKRTTCLISWKSTVIAMATMDGALFKLKHQFRTDAAFTMKNKVCIHRWHRRLGHRDMGAIKRLNNERLADGVQLAKCSEDATKGYRLLDPTSNKVWISRSVKIVEEDRQYARATEQETATSEGAISLMQEGEIDGSIDPSKRATQVKVEDIFGSPWHEPQSESDTEASRNENLSLQGPRRSQRINKGIPPRKLSYKVLIDKASEPSSWEEMLSLPPNERDKWMAAAKEELTSLRNREVWELVKLPAGGKVISSKWVFKLKRNADGAIDTYKARLVARGFSQRYGEEYDETFAPVVRHETIRTLLSIAATRFLHVRHFDVKCAFLNGEIQEELYMQQPPGFEEPGKEDFVLRLKRSIYGLKQSARAWNKKATETLADLGFQRAKADLCLYTRKESSGSTTYVLLYVDDLLVAGETEAITRNVGAQLHKYFVIKDLGKVSHYLGMQIERKEDGSFLLHQSGKIEQLLERLGMSEAKPMGTPMETGYLSTTNESSDPLPNSVKYRQVIGSLLYIATVSRPDIALAVSLLCRRVESPTEYDWKSVKRVLRYLAGTKDMKLYFSAMSKPVLQGYVDADWAGDKADRKSTSGYLFQLGETIISWSTKKQTIVALSSTEAEYVAMAEAFKELLWLRQLLEDFGISQTKATTMFEDNQGCIRLVESDRLNDRTKHISVKYHLLKDLRQGNLLEVKYCPSHLMMADALTKPMSKERLNRFVRHLRLVN